MDTNHPTRPVNIDKLMKLAEPHLIALADDALTKGRISTFRHRQIVTKPQDYMRPSMEYVKDAQGEGLQVSAIFDAALMEELGAQSIQ